MRAARRLQLAGEAGGGREVEARGAGYRHPRRGALAEFRLGDRPGGDEGGGADADGEQNEEDGKRFFHRIMGGRGGKTTGGEWGILGHFVEPGPGGGRAR
ncbi:hypothetical protein JCM17961_41780 [Endothiovibrio diazotrophicus]